ncbi:fibronectin isoform X2 [Parambassis ranga]|nr:fibronectin-like isoform X2 [Parambassis ranga]
MLQKMFVLICWGLSSALMLLHSTAERQYFIPNMNLTWNDARNHCQVCFKELVTLTPENSQAIANRISSDHWIGLRKTIIPKTNSTGNSTSNTTNYATSNFTWSSNGNFTWSSNSYLMNNSTRNTTSNSTSSRTMSWTLWANGDPLAFQNWYPGWPVFKSTIPKSDCCSCSCTCPAKPTPTMSSFTTRYTQFTTTQNRPNITNSSTTTNTTDIPNTTDLTDLTDFTDFTAQNVTDFTSFVNSNNTNSTTTLRPRTNSTTSFTTATPYTTTELPIEATCSRSPMPTPDVPEAEDNYIEDSCVAMLSFGPWVEKNCLEVLPFICYEDRFYSNVTMTLVTANNATLKWESAGDGISHYRIAVNPNDTVEYQQRPNLTCDLFNLKPGTQYKVQVIPVKCERDLTPGNVTFYTKPNKVANLSYSNVTDTSVSLSWDKPLGNLGFYFVKYDKEIKTYVERVDVSGLTPGSNYTFTVISAVEDNSTCSEESYITVYTKPGKVSNLKVSNYTDVSLCLTWDQPIGGVKDYVVWTINGGNLTFNMTNRPEFKVSGLQMATNITFIVAARNHDEQNGENQTIHGYTAPGKVENLTLTSESNSIAASWSFPNAIHIYFNVKVKWNEAVECEKNVTENDYKFTGLKTAAYYTVIVTAVSGGIKGFPVESSKFTTPLQPRSAKAINTTKNTITFEWEPPKNAGSTTYFVTISSSFWNIARNTTVTGTIYKFESLKSGSNYTFEVSTWAGDLRSNPTTVSAYTEPDEREVTLSVLCSSSTALLCDSRTTRENLFKQWRAHFQTKLGGDVSWKFQNVTRPTDTV